MPAVVAMVDLLDEDKLVDELLDYDSVDSNEPAASPPARSTAKHGPQAASSYVRSQPGRSSAGGSATVASGQAAEAAAAFSRLSCGSAGSTDSGGLNSKAASDAAAAFMVGKGAARPPSTIQPGKNPAPQAAVSILPCQAQTSRRLLQMLRHSVLRQCHKGRPGD